jgi:hypothetical protein
MRVLGVDLFSGSLNSRSQPRYSMVLLEDGAVRAREEVSRRRLLRTMRELRPDRIACDNIYELLKKGRERSFYYLLPGNTRVVQVNGPLGAQQPLHVVAREHGVKLSSRASSMEEAETCALLAYMNVGYYAEIFTGESIITVTRARSPGKGGQSENRYRRRVHERVGQKIKEVESLLKEDGIPFELSVVRADYRYSRGEFHVNAPLSRLRKVRRRRGRDVQVKKLPVERKKMEFLPLTIEEKAVLVGIDPGTTTGLAIVNLDGKLCRVISAKNFSLKDILSLLVKYPQVLIVASDVSPVPRLVEKVASTLSSVLYTPPHSLSVAEKKELVDSKFSRDDYGNSHERDALAAALKAYNHFKPKLENLDKRLKEKDLADISVEVKSLAVKGMSLHRAVKSLTKEDKEKKEPKKKTIQKKSPGLIRTLREEIKVLKKERTELRRSLKTLQTKAAKMKKQLERDDRDMRRRLLRDREIMKRNKEIATLRSLLRDERKHKKGLQRELTSLKKRLLLETSDDLVLIKILRRFSRIEIAEERRAIKKGDIIMLPDPAGGGKAAAEMLLQLEPRAIIADKRKLSEAARKVLGRVVLLPPNRVKIKRVEDYGVTDKAALEKEINRELERMRLEKAAAKREWLETYLTKYRRERKKS